MSRLLGCSVVLLLLAMEVVVLSCVCMAGRADRRMRQCWQEQKDNNTESKLRPG